MLGLVVDSKTPVFEFPLKYDWLEGKVLLEEYQVWFTNGSRMDIVAGAGVHGQGNAASMPLEK